MNSDARASQRSLWLAFWIAWSAQCVGVGVYFALSGESWVVLAPIALAAGLSLAAYVHTLRRGRGTDA